MHVNPAGHSPPTQAANNHSFKLKKKIGIFDASVDFLLHMLISKT